MKKLAILLLCFFAGLSNMLYAQNTYEQAIKAYQEGKLNEVISLCEKIIEENKSDESQVKAYTLLGIIYFTKKELNKSLNNYRKALPIAQKLRNTVYLSKIYANTGMVYRLLYNFKEARNNFRKSLSYNPDERTKSSIFNDLGLVYMKEEKYDSSLYYYQKALPLVSRNDKHNVLINLGLLFQYQSKYDSALYYLNDAYEIVKRKYSSNHYLAARTANHLAHTYRLMGENTWAEFILGQLHKNPNTDSTERMRSFILHGDLLRRQDKYAEALAMYQEADKLAPSIRQRISNRSDKEYFARITNQLNRVALRVSLTLGDVATAFYFAERQKGIILLETTQAQRSLGYSPTISVSEIQERLSPEQAVLSYAFFEDSLATFAITSDTLVVYRQAKGNLELDCERFYNLSEHIYMGKVYVDHATRLYNRLIAPITHLLQGHSKLLILPEGRLFIPFDALLTNEVDTNLPPLKWNFSKFPYLIRDYTISYHFSATLAFLPRPPRAYNLDYVGIAPVFGQQYQELPFSILEVQGIKARLAAQGQSTRLYVGDDATKNQMKSLQSKIFHIATHYEDGGLVLKDGSLTLKELYEENYRIESDLAVLSGCQTFYGEFIRGEGPVNLVSHFVEAGSENVLFSFTKIYDEAAQQMVDQFFQKYLEQGLDYAEALRAAKLHFINDSQDFWLPHYSFWAGFGIIETWP